ncbi:MAG: enoyl-CoA hydratase-related protein [Kofleriaceae bacterium]
MSDPVHVQVVLEGPVLRIVIDRPAKKNALTLAMYTAMAEALEQAAANADLRAVLFTSSSGAFTAGNDLGDFLKVPPTSGDTPVVRFLRALMACPLPVVAAVDGAAVGVGVTMLLHCDLVVATDRARFSMPFTKLGLVPEAASSFLLPALVGRQRASAWLLLGQPFDAAEALAAGLVGRVVAPDQLAAVTDGLLAELAALPPQAMRQTKQLIGDGTRAATQAAFDRELGIFVERLRSPETFAAITAFMTKR